MNNFDDLMEFGIIRYKSIFRFLFLACLTFISGCDKQTNPENGFLAGTITIGPICPVETIPPDPKCQPTAETYKAYPVYICTYDGSRKIELIQPAMDGSFNIELEAGNYLIILDKVQHIGSSNLPMELSIKPFKTTTINIDIDTGIR